MERSCLKHFLEAAESLQIKGLSSCSSRPLASHANSSCHTAAVPTDLSTSSSRDRAAAADKQLPQPPRGDLSEQQGSRAAEKNNRTSAAVENSRAAEQSSRTADDGQSAVGEGGPRTDPVQMVRIVKKRSALGATSPRAAKRPKRPQSRQSAGTGPESAEQNLSGKYRYPMVRVPRFIVPLSTSFLVLPGKSSVNSFLVGNTIPVFQFLQKV